MLVRKFGFAVCCIALLTACNDTGTPEAEAPEASAQEADTSAPVAPEPVEATTPAEPAETETVRQADSHVHGDAALAIVLENDTLTLELDTPLYNLTGFEHAPESEDELAIVESAEEVLNAPEKLFAINAGANCVSAENDLDLHLTKETHDNHGHDEEHHDDHEDDHNDHDGDHADQGDDHGDHKDALITYKFTCASPDELKTVSTTLMTEFPNMTELEVVFLGPNSQKVFSLSPTNTEVTLSD